MNVQRPQRVEQNWSAARDLAVAEHMPVFVPLQLHVDDRGWSLMNMLLDVLDPGGQVNFSVQHPGVVKAWHRHNHQVDFWCCVGGHLKAGVVREDDRQAWSEIFGEQTPGVLIIPPGLWHGAECVGPESASLLYYVTKRYDAANPDEERRAFDSIEGFCWGVENR